MRYGRTLVELFVTQAVILAAFVAAPFDLRAEIGTLAAGVVTMAFAALVGSVLYARHRSRMGRTRATIATKLAHLRSSSIA